jgi:hypothetical protein
VLKLYDKGLSQVQIAKRLDMPRATVALDLKSSPGYVPRTTLASFAIPPGRITAAEAAKQYGVTKLQTLLNAIAAGVVRGRSEALAGRRIITTVDVVEIAEDLAKLPECLYPGCERQALAPSGACSGPHARALETMGQSWRTREAIAKSADGIRGSPRPDVRERVALMHADRIKHQEWRLKTLKGRGVGAESIRRAQRALGGARATPAGTRHGGKRPVEAKYPEQAKKALTLRDSGVSLRSIARITGLTKRQVEGVIARAGHPAKVSP